MKLFILTNLLLCIFTGSSALGNDSEKLVNKKYNEKIQRNELIKLNARISNFKCGVNSQKLADAIQKELNLLILKGLKNEIFSNNLKELNNNWISTIDHCSPISEVNLNSQELQNAFLLVRNESYPRYLNLLVDFHQIVGKSKKHIFDYYYEYNLCNSYFRIGNLNTAMDCFSKLIKSHHYQKLSDNDKIKLNLSSLQVEFDKHGCQQNFSTENKTQVKTLPDLIVLVKNIIFEICKKNSKNSTDLINQLSTINESKLFDYDFEYELFYYRFSHSIVSKNYNSAKTLIQARLMSSKEIASDYNYHLYLEASLLFIEKKYEEAKNQFAKIINHNQFSPIMIYRLVLLACLASGSEQKKFCNPDMLHFNKNIDKKYLKISEHIKKMRESKSNSDIGVILNELSITPGSIELYF